MTRRLLRCAVNGLCLLALVVCLATAWLWWRARAGAAAWVDVVASRALVSVWSSPDGLSVSVVRGWRGPPGVWPRSAAGLVDPEDLGFVFMTTNAYDREWQWGRWRCRTDSV